VDQGVGDGGLGRSEGQWFEVFDIVRQMAQIMKDELGLENG
jgi:hypothetical protein